MNNEIFCSGCKKNIYARLTNVREVYPHRLDLYNLSFYICDTCKNFVGTHKGSEKPLGVIATKELKTARIHIHNLIDPLWKNKKIKRGSLYRWIAKELNIKDYHTANTKTLEECRAVYKIGLKIKKELLNNNAR